jgi:hypothetical protein
VFLLSYFLIPCFQILSSYSFINALYIFYLYCL